jgi:ParB family chromosome partitioning protein
MSEEIIPTRKNPKKTGLGRGLNSLLGVDNFSDAEDFEIIENKIPAKTAQTQSEIPTKDTDLSTNRIWNLPIEKIIPNKEQPRKIFTADELKELAASIKEKGIIQPILARKIPGADQYQIIAGERRWRAAQQAGLKEIPVILKEADAQNVLEMALIENIQREDLNPIEESESYQLLVRKYNLTQAEIADRVGKDRATVANIMRLSQLAPTVREMVLKNELQLGQAKVLLSIDDKKAQETLAKKIQGQELSVRAAERLVSAWKSQLQNQGAVQLESEEDEIDGKMYRQLASDLQKTLGTRVHIDFNGRKGRLSIDFYSVAELNKIADKIQGN